MFRYQFGRFVVFGHVVSVSVVVCSSVSVNVGPSSTGGFVDRQIVVGVLFRLFTGRFVGLWLSVRFVCRWCRSVVSSCRWFVVGCWSVFVRFGLRVVGRSVGCRFVVVTGSRSGGRFRISVCLSNGGVGVSVAWRYRWSSVCQISVLISDQFSTQYRTVSLGLGCQIGFGCRFVSQLRPVTTVSWLVDLLLVCDDDLLVFRWSIRFGSGLYRLADRSGDFGWSVTVRFRRYRYDVR